MCITVDHSLESDVVITALEQVITAHGQPVRLSLGNGPEFRRFALETWAAARDLGLHSSR